MFRSTWSLLIYYYILSQLRSRAGYREAQSTMVQSQLYGPFKVTDKTMVQGRLWGGPYNWLWTQVNCIKSSDG